MLKNSSKATNVQSAYKKNKTGFLGRKGSELKNLQNVRNTPTIINGRKFSGHSLDQMQNRGILPSVVENAIANGQRFTVKKGAIGFYDSINKVRVITNAKNGQVITVIRGSP